MPNWHRYFVTDAEMRDAAIEASPKGRIPPLAEIPPLLTRLCPGLTR